MNDRVWKEGKVRIVFIYIFWRRCVHSFQGRQVGSGFCSARRSLQVLWLALKIGRFGCFMCLRCG